MHLHSVSNQKRHGGFKRTASFPKICCCSPERCQIDAKGTIEAVTHAALSEVHVPAVSIILFRLLFFDHSELFQHAKRRAGDAVAAVCCIGFMVEFLYTDRYTRKPLEFE